MAASDELGLHLQIPSAGRVGGAEPEAVSACSQVAPRVDDSTSAVPPDEVPVIEAAESQYCLCIKGCGG